MTPALIAATRADLCLEFANTLYWRGSDPSTEGLRTPEDLAAWCAAQGTLDAGSLKPFARQWKAHPRTAAAAFAEAVALREAIYRVFSSVASGNEAVAADLDLLNTALARAPARATLRRTGKGYCWRAEKTVTTVPLLLAPVLWSAGDLLTGGQLARVRQCGNEKCRWLFLDGSKAGARRWCSMSSCGNRAKAQRHYVRNRQPGASLQAGRSKLGSGA
jgi:predicted RNA-binding Zn ribbon-like protein